MNFNGLRPLWAFMFREYHLTRRYIGWMIVFSFYSLVSSASVALIGVAAKNAKLTLTLAMGAVLWSYLSVLFNEIANSIAFERWEGTLEYTFMAPVSRLMHLLGISLYAVLYSLVRAVIILVGLLFFVHLSVAGGNIFGVLLVLLVGSMAFAGLGLMSAILPVMSPEHGAQATNIFQGVLLLISGIYYPVSVLPKWIQPLAIISPATYVLSASRKLLGIDNPASTSGHMIGASIASVLPQLGALTVMGLVLIPLGLWIFHLAEQWAKRTGKLKRTG
jgi:ABC-2 type transport system permease protein